MLRARPTLTALVTALLLLALTAPQALAKQDARKGATALGLTVSPAQPTTTDSLNVSFTAGKLARDQRYDVSLSIGASSSNCIATQSIRVKGIRRPGRRVAVVLSPIGVSTSGSARYCPGRATVVVSRVNVDAKAVTLAKRTVTVAADDDPGVKTPDTPVRVDLLDGSALLVQAPGRPDRTLPLGGVLRGVIPGKFKPNTDIELRSLAGTLWLRTLTPDALCAGSSYATELGVPASAPATLALKKVGDASLALTVAVAPTALAGCASPPAGTTPLAFSGKVGPLGLTRLGLSAAPAAVTIADGVTATVTATLFVRVDLSGRG
jgi:hypothetical protein